MAEETSIARTIDTYSQEAQYDACVKKILAEKRILAWIMRECVAEFKEYNINQIIECIEGEPKISKIAVDQDEIDYLEEPDEKQIEGLNTEDISIREGKVYYDIKFSAVVPNTNEPVQLIINVEAQKDEPSAYPLIKRAIYYASRMISAQKNRVFTHSHYEKIRKVYSIWIQMNVQDDYEANTINQYSIQETPVIGNVKEAKANYDLITIIILKLGNESKAKAGSILRLLDVLLSATKRPEEKKDILETDFNIPMTDTIKEEVNTMCNLGEGLRERTAIETMANIIINIMINKKISFEEAFSSIFAPEEDRDTIRKYVDANMSVNAS